VIDTNQGSVIFDFGEVLIEIESRQI
jgi:hypothetical protein